MGSKFVESISGGLSLFFTPQATLEISIFGAVVAIAVCLASSAIAVVSLLLVEGALRTAVVVTAIASFVVTAHLIQSDYSALDIRQLEIFSEVSLLALVLSAMLLGRALYLRPKFLWALVLGALCGITLRWLIETPMIIQRTIAICVLIVDAYLIGELMANFARHKAEGEWSERRWLTLRLMCFSLAMTVALVGLVPYAVLHDSMEQALRNHPPPFRIIDNASGLEIPMRPSALLAYASSLRADIWLSPVAMAMGLAFEFPMRVIRRWRLYRSQTSWLRLEREERQTRRYRRFVHRIPQIALLIVVAHALCILALMAVPGDRNLPISYAHVNEGASKLARGDKDGARDAFATAWRLRWSNALAVESLAHTYKLYERDVEQMQTSPGEERLRQNSDARDYALSSAGLFALSVPLFVVEIIRGAGSIRTMPQNFIGIPWAICAILFGMAIMETQRNEKGEIGWLRLLVGLALILIAARAAMWGGQSVFMWLRHFAIH